MKKHLLDTHAIIWFFGDSSKLSANAKAIIDNNTLALSASIVSIWEIAIKVSVKKANFDGNVNSFVKGLQENGIEIVGVLPKHLNIVENLPFIHKDPFDRLLIATAKAENMTIITSDENIHKYNVDWIW